MYARILRQGKHQLYAAKKGKILKTKKFPVSGDTDIAKWWFGVKPQITFRSGEVNVLLKHLNRHPEGIASFFCNLISINAVINMFAAGHLCIEFIEEKVEFRKNHYHRNISWNVYMILDWVQEWNINLRRRANFRRSSSAVCIRRDPERGVSIQSLPEGSSMSRYVSELQHQLPHCMKPFPNWKALLRPLTDKIFNKPPLVTWSWFETLAIMKRKVRVVIWCVLAIDVGCPMPISDIKVLIAAGHKDGWIELGLMRAHLLADVEDASNQGGFSHSCLEKQYDQFLAAYARWWRFTFPTTKIRNLHKGLIRI